MTAASPDTTREHQPKPQTQAPSQPEPSPEEPQGVFEGFTPRQQAPELQHDLSAMRELANSTARKAIATSDSKRRFSEFFFKTCVAAIGILGGVLLLVLNGFRPNMALVGSISGFIVGGLWGYDALVQWKQLTPNTTAANNAPTPSSDTKRP
jgi:hypothetical protein